VVRSLVCAQNPRTLQEGSWLVIDSALGNDDESEQQSDDLEERYLVLILQQAYLRIRSKISALFCLLPCAIQSGW